MAELATSLKRDVGDRQRALDAAIGQIERAFGKGSVMRLGQRDRAGRDRDRLDRLARPRHRARRRRPAARPDRRDLRARIVRQDHAHPALHRRGAEGRRHLRLHRRRARPRPGLCPQARRQPRRAADLAARYRRAGARDRRHAGALGRDRHGRDRLRGRAGAARRARRRDGRSHVGLQARLMSQALRKLTASISRSNCW